MSIRMSRNTIWVVLGIAVGIIVADQLTKYWAKAYLYEAGNYQITILGDFLKFTYIENPGIAFGITLFGGAVGVIIVTVVAILGIAYYFYTIRKDNMPYKICLGLILGGAIGNFIDRVVNGKVIDFIHIDLYRGTVADVYVAVLPIFNIADVAITTAILVIFFWQKKIFEDENKSEPEVVLPTEEVPKAISNSDKEAL